MSECPKKSNNKRIIYLGQLYLKERLKLYKISSIILFSLISVYTSIFAYTGIINNTNRLEITTKVGLSILLINNYKFQDIHDFLELPFSNILLKLFDEEEIEEYFGDLEEAIYVMKNLGLSRRRINLDIILRILTIVIYRIKFEMWHLIKMKLGISDAKKSKNL